MLKVRLNIDQLRRKLARAKQELPAEMERALRELADEAVRLLQNMPAEQRRAHIKQQLARQFARIFIAVRIKHKRRERWPNLGDVYRARIVDGRPTFDGRRRVSVDAQKEMALFDALLRSAMEAPDKSSYEVRFLRLDHRARVEIIRHGGDGIPPAVIAFAAPRLRAAARKAALESLRKAGF